MAKDPADMTVQAARPMIMDHLARRQIALRHLCASITTIFVVLLLAGCSTSQQTAAGPGEDGSQSTGTASTTTGPEPLIPVPSDPSQATPPETVKGPVPVTTDAPGPPPLPNAIVDRCVIQWHLPVDEDHNPGGIVFDSFEGRTVAEIPDGTPRSEGTEFFPPICNQPKDSSSTAAEEPAAGQANDPSIETSMSDDGTTIVVAGTGCPADPNWGEWFEVFITTDTSSARGTGGNIVTPNPDGGHLSSYLVPEVFNAEFETTPDEKGEWRVRIDNGQIESEQQIRAACVNPAGIEHGVVHYPIVYAP